MKTAEVDNVSLSVVTFANRETVNDIKVANNSIVVDTETENGEKNIIIQTQC